jgi:penicillin V acylase-like amidase (Ntn superfamily)
MENCWHQKSGGEDMCTSVKLTNHQEVVLAQNYDFYYGHGLFIVNKKGVRKTALTDNLTEENMYSEESHGAKWVSLYGSVTFNQFARELPTCGMNEAGLAIVSMWHDTVQKTEPQGKNQITELQWIQQQLDCFSSVREVIDNLDSTSFSASMYPMHYHLSDKTGKSVLVELVQGKLKALDDPSLCACSNAGIVQSIEYSQKYLGQDPAKIVIKEPILDRAAKAIQMATDYNQGLQPQDILESTFHILDSVSLKIGFKALFRWIGQGVPPSQTVLQAAFHITQQKIYFRTSSNKNIREIDLSLLDFSAHSTVRVYDVESQGKGDITGEFHDYTPGDNADLVTKSYAPVKDQFPEEAQRELIRYPELLRSV